MRNLTLDEKISIKGKLARKGVAPSVLVQLNTAAALHFHWTCYGSPASMHSTPKLWHARSRRVAVTH